MKSRSKLFNTNLRDALNIWGGTPEDHLPRPERLDGEICLICGWWRFTATGWTLVRNAYRAASVGLSPQMRRDKDDRGASPL